MPDLQEKAASGRVILENVILEALRLHPGGLYNNEIARLLALESDYEGRQKNYLTYSLLGGLLAAGQLVKEKRDGRMFYMVKPNES